MATLASSSSNRVERNMKERNRRMHMKHLLEKLDSLLPQPEPSKLSASQILKDATSYVKQLQRNIEESLNRKKEKSTFDENLMRSSSSRSSSSSSALFPVINITNLGSTLEVNLVTGLNNNFMLYEIISALQEAETEVIETSHQKVVDKTIYTIKSKLGMHV
ncbi:hypothetical protein Dsin_019442, partial [Dipteronia sinensis]